MGAPRTVLSLHAHPDDETLLTGGTLARAASSGHRVVLVVATSGESGLSDSRLSSGLGERRRHEVEMAAAALGVARTVHLGHADSGIDGRQGGGLALTRVPVDSVAAQVAAVLREEDADVLTGYDAHGGYGHPDHVAVHHIARRAATLAGTPLLVEATLDRRLVHRVGWVMRSLGPWSPRLPWEPGQAVYTRHEELTHRVDVRPHLRAKRRALEAHASQTSAPNEVRTLAWALALPWPLFGVVFGTEWFAQQTPPTALSDDVFGKPS